MKEVGNSFFFPTPPEPIYWSALREKKRSEPPNTGGKDGGTNQPARSSKSSHGRRWRERERVPIADNPTSSCSAKYKMPPERMVKFTSLTMASGSVHFSD